MSEQQKSKATKPAARAKVPAAVAAPAETVVNPPVEVVVSEPVSEVVPTAVTEPVPAPAAPLPVVEPVPAKVASKPAAAKRGKSGATAAKSSKTDKPLEKSVAKAAERPADVPAEKGAEKPRKLRLVRDSFTMPEHEYVRIAELKKRLQGLGQSMKKSELLRAGLLLLDALNEAELKAVCARVERIKTGRPAKK